MIPLKIDPARKVYVAPNRSDIPRMHLKHDCSCLIKNGVEVPKVYITQEEAAAQYKATAFCKKCTKPKTRKSTLKWQGTLNHL